MKPREQTIKELKQRLEAKDKAIDMLIEVIRDGELKMAMAKVKHNLEAEKHNETKREFLADAVLTRGLSWFLEQGSRRR